MGRSGQRTYCRPRALHFGDDAREAVAAGRAGRLGGLDHIAFSEVELIQRGSPARAVPFREVASEPMCLAITVPRGAFGPIDLAAARIMGIVNVTPDSFSDGGRYSADESAISHGQRLFAEGADIVDVGGESTRPGSDEVSEEEELKRILPVISELSKHGPVSADTRKPAIMTAARAAGAAVINDVSGLGHDASSAATVAQLSCPVIIMHAQGKPKTMQLSPKYDDVVLDVYDALDGMIAMAEQKGIRRDMIMADPGIGFGKTYEHNLHILRSLTIYHGLGVPLMVGASRKAFIGALTGEKVAAERVSGSTGIALQASMLGAHMLRVHDVKQTKQSLSVFWGALDPASADL